MTTSVWAMLPEAIAAAGVAGSAPDTFATLQHPWVWDASGPKLGRRKLAQLSELGIDRPTILDTVQSEDGATKVLLGYGDDRVEVVHMPRQVSTARVTICLSCQVGCAMGCAFCATSQLGFRRHLTASEMVAGLLVTLHRFGPSDPSDLTLVFMGMGEPLHNLTEVCQAISVITHPRGLGLSPRRITLSTSGLLPELERLRTVPFRPLLAISLNATTDALRQQLMPMAHRYPLAALARLLSSFPLRRGERILVEYVLLAGINDSPEDAVRLADFVVSFPHHVNLLPFNEFPGTPFRRPSEEAIDAFARAILRRRPTVVTVRRSRGMDVRAACGQLARKTGGNSCTTG